MARPFIMLCPLCSRTRRDDPAERICSRCSTDHRELVRLYNEIVRQYPSQKKRTIAQVFRAMWEKRKKR